MAKAQQERNQDEVIDGQLAGDGEIPEWATAEPLDQQIAVHDATYADQHRRVLAGSELLQYAASLISSYEDDDPRMALEIASQVAAATTLDEVLTGVDTTKGREILDTIIEVNALKFTLSTEPGGCPYFALISARDTQSGESHVISVGGWRLVLQLAQIHYMTATLPPGSPYLAVKGAEKTMAPETYPVYFRIRQKPTNTPGRVLNYLARTVD